MLKYPTGTEAKLVGIRLSIATFFISVFSLLSIAATAQPAGYYLPAMGTQGETLKDSLHSIIDGNDVFSYTSSSTDVWDILKQTDRDPQNPDNVILIYSGASVNAAQEYNHAKGWTREHVWAKSRGDFGTSQGPGTDVHHLRPADPGMNSTRNNRSFDTCITCSQVFYDNVSTDNFTDDVDWSFEPRDEVKGDVARMIFYMAVRYEAEDGIDLELVDLLPEKSDKSPQHGKVSVLLKWNQQDPVNDFEENRNEIIYNDFQHNRNPFIDHPELAEYIWGEHKGETWPATATGLANPERKLRTRVSGQSIYVYPQKGVKSVRLVNSAGQQLFAGQLTSEGLQISTSGLSSGIYFLSGGPDICGNAIAIH